MELLSICLHNIFIATHLSSFVYLKGASQQQHLHNTHYPTKSHAGLLCQVLFRCCLERHKNVGVECTLLLSIAPKLHPSTTPCLSVKKKERKFLLVLTALAAHSTRKLVSLGLTTGLVGFFLVADNIIWTTTNWGRDIKGGSKRWRKKIK